jgi:hypothetical protein
MKKFIELQRLLENRRRIQAAENQVKIHDMTLATTEFIKTIKTFWHEVAHGQVPNEPNLAEFTQNFCWKL